MRGREWHGYVKWLLHITQHNRVDITTWNRSEPLKDQTIKKIAG